jgi:hypothetical protein
MRKSFRFANSKKMSKASTEGFPLGNPSTSCGEDVFDWLIHPRDRKDFMENIWERRPSYINRCSKEYHTGIISRRMVENYVNSDASFAENSIILSKDTDEGRIVLSGSEIDLDSLKGNVENDGFDLQAVHPQHKNAKLQALLERLENYTGSLWGANFYFKQSSTPSSYSDNVELFILQLDGTSTWKVYQGEQELSRDSGSDYDIESIGLPILDETLFPGDLLYIPRGMIYTNTADSGPATYLTLSTYQNQSWCDLLSATFSDTLDSICRQDVDFRRGLPINYLSLFGCAIPETDDNRQSRELFKTNIKSLMHKVVDAINLDDIVDQMGSDFIALRTPPVARKRKGEEVLTFGPDPRLHNDLGIRIRNPNWVRIVQDTPDTLLVFSCLQNEIANHMRTDNPMDNEPTSFEIDASKNLDGLRDMISVWPKFVSIASISREVAGELWEAGVVETKELTKQQKI